MARFDYVLVGGGLQNALVALALAKGRPDARVAIVERGQRLGGNHTWCFHSGDVAADAAEFVDPLVVRRWSGYSVQFPHLERELEEPYAAVTSERLHDVLAGVALSSPRLELRLGSSARELRAGAVELDSGELLEAEVVVDARGPESCAVGGAAGYQKFVGQELEVEPGATPVRPIVMDARVPQRDGFRFFYVLPLSPTRVLVEDTYFSDSPRLDRSALREEIARYAAALGLAVRGVAREEAGVLPLPKTPLPAFEPVDGLVRGGYQGGWFHPTTGYSFPLAVRFAREVGGSEPRDLALRLARLGRERARQQRFCTLLNRLLFDAFEPEQRFHVLERFYRLPAPTVRRFYALALTPADRLRLLCGRPPAGFGLARLFASSRDLRRTVETSGENA